MKKGKEGPQPLSRSPRVALAACGCKAKQRDCDILEAFLQLQMEETDGYNSDT